MKKVAYIFHGHARTWHRCYQSFFDNIFSVMPGDVFIHTWENLNSKSSSHWTNYSQYSDTQQKISSSLVDIDAIKSAYNAQKIIVEKHPPEIPDDPNLSPSMNQKWKAILGVKNMLFSSRKIFECARSTGKYDTYFSLRMDILWKSKINLNAINENKLSCPVLAWPNNPIFAWDLFSIGNEHLMDVKTSYYNHIDSYWYNHPIHPLEKNAPLYEVSLTDYYRDNSVEFEPIQGLEFEVVRMF